MESPQTLPTLLRFTPYYKSVLWGGQRIGAFKREQLPDEQIGESWEISGLEGKSSVVAEGPLSGTDLRRLLKIHGREMIGERLYGIFGEGFPLLVKFIDSRERLSVQVHPDDRMARERHGSSGKTEMWFCIDPEPGAYLVSGFNKKITKEELPGLIENGKLTDVLAKYDTHAGDIFFLPAGHIHAIGPGNLILEIQQASDITYRLYDYNRRDADGNLRELHIEQACEAINLDNFCQDVTNTSAFAGDIAALIRSDYFDVDLLRVDGSMEIDTRKVDSFIIIVCVEGAVELNSGADQLNLQRGQTAFATAHAGKVTLRGQGKVIASYISDNPLV